MGKVPAEELAAGMRLARPVANKNGLVMLGEDTELTEALIEKIRKMGIPSVYIKGVAAALPPKDEMIAQLHNRFKNVASMPYMDILERILVEHIEELHEEHRPKNT